MRYLPGRPLGASSSSVVNEAPSESGLLALQVLRLSSARLIDAIHNGLSVSEMQALAEGLNLPMDRLAPLLGISKATWHRRKLSGRLDASESDRLIRFARLLAQATEVLETPVQARQWLGSPQIGLGGAIPLEYAATEVGAREVEDLLSRIEYSVYS
jgi:putative toxin-antitoxin system antitoxin component (TIGR02293 family)